MDLLVKVCINKSEVKLNYKECQKTRQKKLQLLGTNQLEKRWNKVNSCLNLQPQIKTVTETQRPINSSAKDKVKRVWEVLMEAKISLDKLSRSTRKG